MVIIACLLTGPVLVRCGWRTGRVAGLAGVLVAVQWTVAAVIGAIWASSAASIAGTAVMALCLLVPVLVATTTRRRQEYTDAGWQLAEAQDRLRAVAVHRAVVEERAAMAAEIHDALGHRIALIAVQAGRLSLDPALADDVRDGLRAIRSAAADATAEPGQTVDLLACPDGSSAAGIDGATIEDLLVGARSAGLAVTADIDDDLTGGLSDDARAAALRVIREGLTNSLRRACAPDARVTAHHQDGDVIIRIDNPTGTGPGADPDGSDVATPQDRGTG
ncbi:sensor histidine kinase [Pseudonocardia parietis]|uniref:histidine kinase n=1 Tax=Pseudonocardia parietis TaxID=570936 RepID=A0ABS4VU85_9PSEU|nr:histidine kinase [Pseudonocardia parietis]MBP2367498.1 signal transduction histidine kinase [Pseudonocardia parietis]